jgi:membrane protein GlpM
MLALLFKSMLGAAAVMLIAVLSRTSNFFIAGLVPLFPTFALIAHYIVGTERTPADLQITALFGLCSLLPYGAYLLAVYLLCTRMSLTNTLLLATLAWLICAAMLLLIWTHWRS